MSLCLNKSKVDLHVGNKSQVVTLTLPSGLSLELDNCFFVIILSRNIVSIFNGFKIIIKGKYFFFYNNDV